MKIDTNNLISIIQQWLHLKSTALVSGDLFEPPLPPELFSADQMERFGITLALSHELAQKSVSDMLLDRLSHSEAILVDSCNILSKKIPSHDVLSPASEWLLDNFYLIQEQIHSIRHNLPRGYGRALPQLAGDLPGYPRIYDIALQVIEHGDGHWEQENLRRFITAYQGVTQLTIGELWALPIALGVALIENLSRASERIVADRNHRNLANYWADTMLEVAVSEPKKLVLIIADMARSEPPMSPAFVAELARRLQGAALALPLNWIEQHLADTGLTIEQLIREENTQQAANQLTVSNSIASLRRLTEVNWCDFVESMSIIDKTLAQDPADIYTRMDFGTRDHYRHVVERLSRTSTHSEEEVAKAAIQLAKAQFENAATDNKSLENTRVSHVGFYLIDKGRRQLEKVLDVRPTLRERLRKLSSKWPLFYFLGSLTLISVSLIYGLLSKANLQGVSQGWLWLLGIVIAICGGQLALALVNWAATLLVKPQRLPRMDFSKAIPAEFRTLVVVPTLLSSAEEIDSLIEGLEVRFLGNRDQNVHFALLTDFNDAPTASTPEDLSLITLAQQRIAELNQRYSRDGQDSFFLFHRPRQWSETEQIWMGKERKRGKLTDLNDLLRGNNESRFSLIEGRTDILAGVKYVITLDSDTQLPRDSARQMIAAMAHPLNRPVLDPKKGRVICGYGILQPRIGEALPLSGPTLYVRLCGNEFGIDPYTRAVSDVYQDLFQEGSFIGKGIYDVDLFHQVLGRRLPDNRILSHDLLEGCYLHSGFLSDISLYEKSPGSYLSDAKRRTRWVRGDWQLMAWLLPWVLKGNGQRETNPLSLLSRVKIFENLWRSIRPVALLVLLILSWTVLPAGVFWFGVTIAFVVLPPVIATLVELTRKPSNVLPRQHAANIIHLINRRASQLILYLTCLPHEAWYSLTAIIRTCWRVMVSKRHLLEWVPSHYVDRYQRDSLLEWLSKMWMGPLIAIAATYLLIMKEKWGYLLVAAPLLLLWLASPFIMRYLSRPVQRSEPKLAATQIRFLHRVARKTWSFFETFITEQDHWLPPDNYQEAPIAVLARRTSPTNIGLSLLANLTAYDFGYINLSQLLARTQNTLQTMNKLERYRGHLYNWYSTETLAPLLPRYVSTVDSGNLAGHLLTLRQGLLTLPDAPLLNMRYIDGLEDSWEVLTTTLNLPLPPELTHFQKLLQGARLAFANWSSALNACNGLCIAAEQIASLPTVVESASQEITDWSNKLVQQCRAICDEITYFAGVEGLTAETSLRDIANMPLTDDVDSHGQIQAIQGAKISIALIDTLAATAFSLAQMDVSFLFDEGCQLMTIGFNVDEQRIDASNYDLLSSEARLGCFVAIAQSQIPQESWFALGRLLVSSGGEPILLSWSGSMFEYLMPLLVMPTYSGTLLDQTHRAAVSRQVSYGKHIGLPWGISESGYNAVDNQFNYLYRAFGVPGLGLKRGLEEDLVIAPYATAMALMVAPEEACANLQRLAAEYALGKFGFYEAIDFTLTRLPRDSKRVLVRSFMAHHQGMSLLAFSYLLHNQPMQQRFEADPLFQSALLLLQERIPKPNASYLHVPTAAIGVAVSHRPEALLRAFTTPNTRSPQVQLLSNGNYHLMLTQAGGGYSRWRDIAVTRWREDSTCDNWGLFSYVRDLDSGSYWSTSYQPTVGDEVENFKAVFSQAHADFSRSDRKLDTHTEVVVSPEDDIELRRIRIHNRAKVARNIEFTSYAEIVLAPQAADQSQPAFSNLFVETELLPQEQAILATRRPRDAHQSSPWMFHRLNVYTDKPLHLSYETDRSRFIGRGGSLAKPLAMKEPGDLSNTAGAVLDPIVAIRCKLRLEPDALVIFDLITGVTEARESCMVLVEKYHDRNFANRIFGLAWTHGQVLLHQLNISETDAQLYGKLASSIIYTNPQRRAEANILASNRRGQSGLWGYAISGDLPIVLLHIQDAVNLELARQLIQAQSYWRRNGLLVDLVILNEEHTSYRQTLQDLIMSLVASTTITATNQGGSIVVRATDQVPIEDRILLESAARVVLSDKRGTLKEQLDRRRIRAPLMPTLNVSKLPLQVMSSKLPLPEDLQFFNGLGGYNRAGDEYIIRLNNGTTTPAPWCNVLANPNFATIVSESGQGYTWTENAHEFRLTPWENDPVQDLAGEAFYLRDEETSVFWSPTALPRRGYGDYQVRHGFGYSVFEHIEDGIYTELWMYVAKEAPLKFAVLKIRNDSLRTRRLSATGYVAWVLGDLRSKNAMHVVTELTPNGVLLAQNHYNTEFGERTAFFNATTSKIGLNERTITCDRNEFLGRNGNLQQPAALSRMRLSGRTGAGLDPCSAIQLAFDLPAGASREIVFTLGAGRDKQEAENIAERYYGATAAAEALRAVRDNWRYLLSRVQVATPDPSVNFLANGWLLYQVLSSRLWGRSGYYQSGGAFGFRDQLQDVMALTQVAPELLRAHLQVCAAHQFEEGDVQHWWHPPLDRGVRTRCSDDYLWLPFGLCHYVETTGDMTVLDEMVTFLQGRPLHPEEESYYDLPTIGVQGYSLYEHAVRAIKNGLKFGEHGLPLIGSGDWNDGMSLVGIEGRGESVWLAFFLYTVLKHFAKLAVRYGDNAFAARCEAEGAQLQQKIEAHAWDGEWYRRAYFDDGTPLGSAANTECRIDSIAQSWSILSGAGEPSRSKQALDSLYKHLVRPEEGLIKLLDPPFDKSIPNPGYIEGYVPGIRENGGQYTHAAIWAAMAFAVSTEKQRAWQLFSILNPINHGRTPEEIDRYKIEPYVVAADVYSVPPHVGRGGWSWYTGSAGWLYRLIIETLLGLQLKNGNQLHLKPILAEGWQEFSIDYYFGQTLYKITINAATKRAIFLDQVEISEEFISLVDDGEVHHIHLGMPSDDLRG